MLPNGKIGYSGNYEFPDNARVLDVSTQTWTTVDPKVTDGYAVMYEPGKVLKCGSSADSGTPGSSLKTCNIIEFTATIPAWQAVSSMANARTHHNMTILPDGNVLGTGGGTQRVNMGTISGATWSTSGKNGKALQFNGVNAFVTVAGASSLRLTAGMTLEAWVRPSTLTNWRTVTSERRHI